MFGARGISGLPKLVLEKVGGWKEEPLTVEKARYGAYGIRPKPQRAEPHGFPTPWTTASPNWVRKTITTTTKKTEIFT